MRQRDHRAEYRERSKAWKHLYGRRWQRERLAFLALHPLCVMCSTDTHPVNATVVDHITPHNGDEVMFFDQRNWQPLCKACHDGPKQRLEKTGKVMGCDECGIPLDRAHHWKH
jgi:5-methylcytosine-specific restriction endonuclease McrA